MSRRALLIVDVQNGFINDATQHIVSKVEKLQNEYEHVYATRFVNPKTSPYRELLGWERFGEGSADVPLAFRPVEGVEVFDKSVYTSASEDFLRKLRDKGIDEVFVCGISTDACVSATAVDLFENGIRPVVLAGACASHGGMEYHEAALRILRRLIGKEQVVE